MMTRQEAAEVLEELKKPGRFTILAPEGVSDALQMAIDALLSAQPERKTGHWIDKTDPEWDGEWGDWECSCCGVVLSSMAINLNGTYLYCPKCGKDMRGEQDG